MSQEANNPVSASHDAILDITQSKVRPGRAVVVIVKQVFDVAGGRPLIATPQPLFGDFRDPDQSPRRVPGTDFWPKKPGTDIVVQGSAFAPAGKVVHTMDVEVTVADRTKRVRVVGRRVLVCTAQSMHFSVSEPITEVPMTVESAYGGFDGRVRDENITDPQMREVETLCDHPGLYPRNPFGKGYVVGSSPLGQDVELPLLEDPSDMIDVRRVLTPDAQIWFKQPLPWHAPSSPECTSHFPPAHTSTVRALFSTTHYNRSSRRWTKGADAMRRRRRRPSCPGRLPRAFALSVCPGRCAGRDPFRPIGRSGR
ncbi:MAG: DUF2169 domain-containing protein [Nannocystaceae bacterium]